MFTHHSEEESLKMAALARSHPEVYNALFEQEQEQRQKTLEKPDVLDRLVRIKKFFRRNQ